MKNKIVSLSHFFRRTIFISSVLTIFSLMVYNYLNFKYQTSILENNYTQKIEKVLRFNEDDILNEIILNQTESLTNHITYLINELDVDSIKLNNFKTHKSVHQTNNANTNTLAYISSKLANKYVYEYKLMNINNESFGTLEIYYGSSLFINGIVKLIVNFIINLCLVILGYSILSYLFNKRMDKNLIAPISELSSNLNKIDELRKAKYSIREVESLRNALIDTNEIKEKYFELNIKSKKYEITRQVAHDIASPLSTLRTLLNFIQFRDEKTKMLYNSALGRLMQISEDILIEHKKERNTIASCSELSLFFDEKMFELKSKNILFSIEYHATDLDYEIGKHIALIKRILSNIINNSADSLVHKENPKIAIKVEKYQDTIVINVSDNGQGIDKEILNKLTTSEITTKGHGNGIALFSAKNALDKIGGSISISSQVNVGTEVTIKLPISKEIDRQPELVI